MRAARFLAFGVGFLSLSLEILWIRLFSFANHSLPQAFSFVLVFYLLGIALGAHIGRCYCDSSRHLWKTCGFVLLLSSLSDLITPWIYASLSSTNQQLFIGAVMIFISALLKAIVFPIVHALGTPAKTNKIGYCVSRVYVANIFGATLGPLFTGVVLLFFFNTQQCFMICAGLSCLFAMYCFFREIHLSLFVLATFASIVLTLSLIRLDNNQLLTLIADKQWPIRRIVENQHGIVITYKGDSGGDVVTGGNVYDGRTNLDPIINSNKINRLIILAALHDKPSNVLIIGLSIGTWLKIVTSFPGIERIDVVEINPGYLNAIEDYPRQKSGLEDSRVHLHIADIRHWLKVHPTRQFDLIIMNTTYHWRNYSTQIISQDFLRLIKQHMKPGAVLTYNTTFSPDVIKTAATVFQNVYLYDSFLISADFDWRKKLAQPAALKKLAALQLDGHPLYPAGHRATILAHLNLATPSLKSIEADFHSKGRQLEIITDRNVITEYKYGKNILGR